MLGKNLPMHVSSKTELISTLIISRKCSKMIPNCHSKNVYKKFGKISLNIHKVTLESYKSSCPDEISYTPESEAFQIVCK